MKHVVQRFFEESVVDELGLFAQGKILQLTPLGRKQILQNVANLFV
jgi:hypothetical protein